MYKYMRVDARIYLAYKDVVSGTTLSAEPGGVYDILPTRPDLPMPPPGFEEVQETKAALVKDKPAVEAAPVNTESDGE